MSTKKNKINQQELIKAQLQKQRSIAEQYKNKMRPFVKFLKKHELKFNHARVGNSRIQYFRLDQFQKLITKHQNQIEQNENLKNVYRQIRQELVYFKRPSHIKSKYPNVLQPVSPNDSDKKFASFRFDTTQSKKWMTIGLILGVLSLVLFPIWPYQLKYGIWLVSLILLIILVGLIVFRLVIYFICVIFGYNVWIFPNLMGQYGFWDSFRPIIYYEKWEMSLYNVLIRVFVFSALIAYGCYLYLNPGLFQENIQLTKQTLYDIHDWGVEKIKNSKNFSQRAITNLEDILNETADVVPESSNAQYTSFNEEAGTDL